MPTRHSELFRDIANFPALVTAARRAVRGKRRKPGAAAFMAGLEREILRLEREIRGGTWRPGRYTEIEVHEPKRRVVSAAPFRDRVVHHALCAVIEPIFERGFVFDSYANRAGKGSHAAVARYESFRDRYRHVLRCDIYRYFPAIDHEILKRDIRRRIACAQTLRLVDAVIDGSNPQEPVELYYSGDDLFTPFGRRRGLPIGNLTSQFFANVFLDGFDHYVKEVLRAPGYLRYVDDFALFHDDAAVLAEWRRRIESWLGRRRLSLHPGKTFAAPTAAPAAFLGYVLLPGGVRRLPDDNVRRFRNRLRGLRDGWRAGAVTREAIERRIGAWIAHAEHADTWRLRAAIFRDGWFDPSRGPDRSPVVCCAAAPGTTTRGTSALPTATGTTPATGTTTTGSAWRARAPARTGAFTDAPGVRERVQGRP
ncbi:MAG: RNA-directed DNA polymerase [Alphaproteobacteria bacterium]|nr:RNA-directed DNA polymerase [Alphaproteobacteria bacterium]